MSSADPNTIPAVNLKLQYEPLREEIAAAVARVLDRQNFVLGSEVSELEQAVAALTGCAHAVGCASGSDALILSLQALGIGVGDSVIVPPLSFFATAGAVVRVGGKPIFADIDPRTFNINPASIESLLADPVHSGRIKAIMPVHLYGQCAEMDALLAIAKAQGLHVIEDSAQAILATNCGRPAGSLGIAGAFSFYPTKNLSAAGDAGMITTQDAALDLRLRRLRNHGSTDRINYPEVGINSRLDTIQAAILLVKLKYIQQWTEKRRQHAAEYRHLFAEVFGYAGRFDAGAIYPSLASPVVLPYEQRSGEHVYHQFTIRALRRNELAAHLRSQGIETTVYYPVALHLQPAFLHHGAEQAHCPEAARAADEVLSLPMYPELTSQQQERIVSAVHAFYIG